MSALWICGAGAVSPAGDGGSGPRRVPEGLPLRAGFPASAVRWLDACSLWWVNAARSAAGGGLDPGWGQVVGLGWTSVAPVQEILTACHRRGFAAMPPARFPLSVGNAPAGQAGLLLGLRGGAVTLNGKEAAGLAALLEACRLLRAGLLEGCLSGGVDELDPFLLRLLRHIRPSGSPPLGEGAYALLLKRSAAAPPGALCRVAAWAQCGAPCPPHRYPDAVPLLERLSADLSRADDLPPDWVCLPADTPALAEAASSWAGRRWPRARRISFQPRLGVCGASWAGAAAEAAGAVARGEAGRVLLMAVATGGAAYALTLEAERGQ